MHSMWRSVEQALQQRCSGLFISVHQHVHSFSLFPFSSDDAGISGGDDDDDDDDDGISGADDDDDDDDTGTNDDEEADGGGGAAESRLQLPKSSLGGQEKPASPLCWASHRGAVG
jgi:hypothetical protein